MFKLEPLPRTLGAALRDVGHDKVAVRRSAVRDLGRFVDAPEREGAVEALRKALRDAEPDVRADAVVALCDLGERSVVPELIRLLGDAQLRVRQMALLGLGELGTADQPEIVGRLGSFLSAGEPALRFQALSAWAALVPEKLAEAIVERAQDSDPEVRTLALRLIEEHWIETDAELPETLVSAARARLKDVAPTVHLLAAVILGRAGHATDTDVLLATVQRRLKVSDPADEQVAIELCGSLGVRAAIPALRRRAFGLFGWTRDPFLWQARVALAQLGDERAVQAILKGLSSRLWHVRAVAVDAAGRAGVQAARPRLLELLNDESLDRAHVEAALRSLSDPES